jgi:hypothetical protein
MMRFLTTLAVAATTVTVQADRPLLSARSRASLDGRVPSTISVGVFAPPDVTESLVIRVFDEAKAIWGPADIAIDWHRITSKNMAAAWQLTVTIDDEKEGFAGGRGALGWIPFTADGPAPTIHLSRANAEALIRQTPGVTAVTIGVREILIGRALGRALSHEIGHYLLKSRVHTPRGLMRANWPSDELLSSDRRGFELTAEQRAATVGGGGPPSLGLNSAPSFGGQPPRDDDSRSSLQGWDLNASHDTFGFQFTNVPFGLSFHAQTCSV